MTESERNAAHETEPGNRPAGAKGDSLAGPGGIVLDQYVLLEKLSASRTGLIFKAQHRLMGRIVAVKFLSPEAAASTALGARFHRAIQILARLEHRNLVKAFEAGEQGGTHYLVMEYVDGQDLRSLVKERKAPLGVEEAVRYTIQAAAGLAAAHQQGVCHRNIKPGNLLVDREGMVKIVGFMLAHVEAGGAASAAGVEDNLTRQGQVMGTCDYMSPEQALDSSSVDRRADIYSLGCTLHYLLTGRPPYVAKGAMQQLLAHRSQPIPSLCQARPEVPEALDQIFQKMLAKAPGDRYASMEEVMAEMEASLTAPAAAAETTADNLRAAIGLPASPARASASDKAAPKPKSRAARHGPRTVPIVVGGVLAVLAFVFAVQYFQSRTSPQAAKSPAPHKTDEPSAAAPSGKQAPAPGQPPDASKGVFQEATPRPPAIDRTAAERPPLPAKEVPPEPKPAPKPEPRAEPEPQPEAKPAEPEKMTAKPEVSPIAVPDETARQRASKLVRDMFQEEIEKARSSAEKSALARKILSQAKGLNDDPAGRYAMLETCCSLAKEAVDAATALEAMDAISRYYAVGAWSAKASLLADFAKVAKTPPQHGALAQRASALAQEAIHAGQFETAAKLSERAVAEAAKARDLRASARIRAAAKEIEQAVAMHGEYETAKAKLQENPQNPAANLAAGRYECLTLDNWNEGLRKLAAGSDETLRALAAKDLADPKDPEQQAGIGDGWWELAKEESGIAQVQFYRRAARWYEKASPQATGLLKSKIDKRLETIKAVIAMPVSP